MRTVDKSGVPLVLVRWRKARRDADQSVHYDQLGASEQTALRSSLAIEQRGLCAYTGISITPEDFHIEHLKPRSRCTDEETTDYLNVVAAYDRFGPCTFGARYKADWFEPDKFVSPLDEDAEQRFSCRIDGSITSADPTDVAAIETIERLALDADELTELREAAIGILLFEEPSLEQVLSKLEKSSAGTGELTAFEFAARSVALQLIEQRTGGQLSPIEA